MSRPFKDTSPMPAFYYYVFAKIEPALSLIGAAYALGWPTTYSDASFSFKDVILLGERGGGPRGVLITRGLGSCYLLFALISAFLIPTLTANLHSQPVIHENILTTFLLCLALGDISHVLSTISAVPTSIYSSPSKWSVLLWGNVGITAALFCVRVAWFVGANRPTYSLKTEKIEPRPKERPGAYGRVPQEKDQ